MSQGSPEGFKIDPFRRLSDSAFECLTAGVIGLGVGEGGCGRTIPVG